VTRDSLIPYTYRHLRCRFEFDAQFPEPTSECGSSSIPNIWPSGSTSLLRNPTEAPLLAGISVIVIGLPVSIHPWSSQT
jgi:hypothetical protein